MDASFRPPPNPNLPQPTPRIYFIGYIICLFTFVAVKEPDLLPIFTLSSTAAALSMVIYGFGFFFPQHINHPMFQKLSQIAVMVGILWGYHSCDLSTHNGLIMLFQSTLTGACYGTLVFRNRFNFWIGQALIVTLCLVVPFLLPHEFDRRKYVFYAGFAAFSGFNIVRCFSYGGLRVNPLAKNAVAA